MSRQISWIPALVLVGVAVFGAAPASAAAAQGRQDPPQTARDGKEGKDRKDGNGDKSPAPSSERERWKWWLYDRTELGITDQQSTQINQIFESTIPKLRESRQELDRAEEDLARTIKESKADLSVVSAQLDRVQAARTTHDKTRVLMLYRIDLLLNADQRAKVNALRARQDAARRERDKQQSNHRRRP